MNILAEYSVFFLWEYCIAGKWSQYPCNAFLPLKVDWFHEPLIFTLAGKLMVHRGIKREDWARVTHLCELRPCMYLNSHRHKIMTFNLFYISFLTLSNKFLVVLLHLICKCANSPDCSVYVWSPDFSGSQRLWTSTWNHQWKCHRWLSGTVSAWKQNGIRMWYPIYIGWIKGNRMFGWAVVISSFLHW